MFYLTGDIHGNQVLWDTCINSFLKSGDKIAVPGDIGIGFFDGKFWTEEMFFDYIAEQDYTVLFCDGNHENFEKLNGYVVSDWNGGRVHFIRNNLIHLMRGEIYEIDGSTFLTFGGGFSIDKEFREPRNIWWPEEMPNASEYENASNNLIRHDCKVDYILTHTAPGDTVAYLSYLNLGIRNNILEEKPLTDFLNWVANTVEYKKWYFGHYHIDRELWRNQYVLLHAIRELHTGKLIKMRI